ncbi:cupin domain-containing protein [Actinokineospora enzanensis]|uniref:cupin domain-containing protein n=1 Tax=Actinokineospora enzanensis TaxID=155975 RepID=UPI00037150C6|nr:cupin domain-containing protein [Actinokineospora enzanensis]
MSTEGTTTPRPLSVQRDLPVFKQIEGHHAPTPFFLTTDMLGGLPVELAGAEISNLVDKPVAAPHTHEVPEIYLLLSPEPGGAEIEVRLDGETHTLEAPGALLIPAGSVHCFVTRRAIPGSYCLGLLLTGPGPGEGVRVPRPEPSA